MNARGPGSAVDRVPAIQHACDLDLLLFFKRHPRALLTSDQIVSYLGYDRERVARSLEGVITAGHLTRSQQPSRAVRLYVLTNDGAGGPLSTLLDIASTREGRGAVLRHLASRNGGGGARLEDREPFIKRVA